MQGMHARVWLLASRGRIAFSTGSNMCADMLSVTCNERCHHARLGGNGVIVAQQHRPGL